MIHTISEPRQKKEKGKNEKSQYSVWNNVRFMVKLAWVEKEKKILLLTGLGALFAVANNLINLYITPMILSAVERKAPVGELIGIILLFMAGLIVCAAAADYIQINHSSGRLTLRWSIKELLTRKAATTAYPNTINETFNKMFARALVSTNATYQATQAIWQSLGSLLQNVLGFAIYLSMLTVVSPLLLSMVLVTSIMGYLVTRKLNGYGFRHREEAAGYENRLSYANTCASNSEAAKDIRLFHLRPWLQELESKALDSLLAFHRRAEGVYLWARILDLVLTFLRNGLAYAYLIRLVLDGQLTASEFLLYFSAIGGFTTWVTGILENSITLYRQSLDISTIREVLDFPEPFRFEDGISLEPDKQKPYEIRLENVSFRYPESSKDILSNINLIIHPGEKLAVVGLNGAGKTTLIKLICGFLDPTEGRILLNGRDIREYNRRDYYRMFSAVFQDFSILACSIAANVAQSEDNIDLHRVKVCIDKAGLTDKIQSLPDGYDTHLVRTVYDDAIMLSGGETQRLMLARALYKDAPFIVLDEPTAALDPIAEADLYQKYADMTEGCLSIYISHRLASTRFCDRIVLIENGGIAEDGTHEELLALGGTYAQLFAVQSKYYQEGGLEDELSE